MAAFAPGRRRLAHRVLALVMLAVLIVMPRADAAPAVNISAQSEQILASLLAARNKAEPGQRAQVVSGELLGTPYGANTLIGSATEPEQLVIDLEAMDCFTYADYVEALKRGSDRQSFLDALRTVRYRDGVVDFAHRKHFFTDWAAVSPPIATDVTDTLGADAVRVTKNLNDKGSGAMYLPGLPVVTRDVAYVPSSAVDDTVVRGLRTGDYLGAYAPDDGLDVSHVGIVVNTADGPVFRNASSLAADNKVVDTPLADYLATVPGIVVLRPLQ